MLLQPYQQVIYRQQMSSGTDLDMNNYDMAQQLSLFLDQCMSQQELKDQLKLHVHIPLIEHTALLDTLLVHIPHHQIQEH